MISLGIDIGSTTTKGVLLNSELQVINSSIIHTGSTPKESAAIIIENLSNKAKPDVIYATGYGRSLIDTADKKITEITCHGAGINSLHPDAQAIIDIGGQDSKAIHLGARGKIIDFAMNDKCAAGTGSFLDNIAHKFTIPYDTMSTLYHNATETVNINSTCVVFAESEIIGLLATGKSIENIFAGVLKAIAARVSRLYTQVKAPCKSPIYFTGGVAKNTAMQEALASEIGCDIIVERDSQLMGAIGAAVLAQRDLS